MGRLTDCPGAVRLQKPIPVPMSLPLLKGAHSSPSVHAVMLYPATEPPEIEHKLPGLPSVPFNQGIEC